MNRQIREAKNYIGLFFDGNTHNFLHEGKALLLECWLKREIFPKLEEIESVYSFLAEHLAFMQEIMSVPIEEQPDVIFCLPDLPVHIERRKVKK